MCRRNKFLIVLGFLFVVALAGLYFGLWIIMAPHTFTSIEECERAFLGKTPEEIEHLIGKPPYYGGTRKEFEKGVLPGRKLAWQPEIEQLRAWTTRDGTSTIYFDKNNRAVKIYFDTEIRTRSYFDKILHCLGL